MYFLGCGYALFGKFWYCYAVFKNFHYGYALIRVQLSLFGCFWVWLRLVFYSFRQGYAHVWMFGHVSSPCAGSVLRSTPEMGVTDDVLMVPSPSPSIVVCMVCIDGLAVCRFFSLPLNSLVLCLSWGKFPLCNSVRLGIYNPFLVLHYKSKRRRRKTSPFYRPLFCCRAKGRTRHETRN